MTQRSTATVHLQLAALLAATLRGLASLGLAIFLLVSLATVLAWGSLLEAEHGREHAHWYVYGSSWFVGLLALLGTNILAATWIRFPWSWRQSGFVVTHAGLLVLLAGAILTFFGAIEGQVVLQEKQRTDQFLVTQRSVVTAVGRTSRGRVSTQFSFSPGPVDWPADKALDFGTDGGLGLKVLRFYRHARPRTEWVADQRDYQGPALQLRLYGPTGNPVAEDWLAANAFGGEAIIGPTKYDLLPLPVATMREDFVEPPGELAGAGVLSVHYADRLQRVQVDGNVGRRIEIGERGAAVEIVQYLPDAKPTPKGSFVSVSTKPRNPLLDLNVYLPGREQPTRQVAFALRPLLNLDGVHGEICPVKFWYHHAGLKAIPGAVFAQTPDGKLYCRAAVNEAYTSAREVQAGGRIDLGGQFSVVVQQYLPRARQEVSFWPVEPPRGQNDPPEAAALVEVTVDGQRRGVWLQRGDAQYGAQTIFTNRGSLALTFGYEQRPLGYAIELEDFTRRTNPGGLGQAAVSSLVRVTDPARGKTERREISPNQPLAHGQYTLYQSSFRESSSHGEVSVLTATRDPGRWLKYLGSLMICGGILIMFTVRSYLFQGSPALFGGRVVRTSVLLLVGPALWAAPSAAWSGDGSEFHWDPWRYLPVQDGGRAKPLDTLARETCRLLSNRTRTTDPARGQTLDAATLYLVMLLDWQGWDQEDAVKPNPHAVGHLPTTGSYDRVHRPDKWDHSPLLRVDSLALRAALGMPQREAYVSPVALNQAKIRLQESGDERPFVHWAEGLAHREQEGLTEFEEEALQLVRKFRVYQDHRMGKRLAVVPIQGSEEQQWISVFDLAMTEWDDESDPTGLMRQARQQFQAARAAYLRNSGPDFNRASAAFRGAVGQLGPQLGAYPSLSKIHLEVVYNHVAPFRIAWILTAVSFLSLLLSLATRWKPFHIVGWASFVAGMVAMLAGFGMRVAISGRAPVTNMYESVVYVGFGVAALGIVLELIDRRQFILTAAAGMAAVASVLADSCPTVLDPSLQPLQPVLRSNFWLVTHVMTITLSYAALALALGIGNITLGFFLAGSEDQPTIRRLTDSTYRTLQVGVLLLAAGTILGAVWADYSWGRFWGWDPKEVWALVALLAYVAVLHARSAGWVREFGLAALSVMCFSLVVMAWYGVNFVLGAGLHSYGFGGGGQMYVVGAIAVQGLYVATAGVRYVVSGAAAEAHRAADGQAASLAAPTK